MEVITISNHKGGCGKTTTAVNLAAYLAIQGYRTVLMDLDPQGAATIGCGISKKELSIQMLDVFLGRAPLVEVIKPSTISKLNIAPCNLNLVSAEAHLAGQPGKEFVIKEQLDLLEASKEPKTKYDYVVIDTPPNMGTLTLNGLVAADSVIIPIQCEYYALEGVEQLEFVLQLLGKRFGRKPKVHVLLTMFDARTNLSREVVHDVTQHFQEKVFVTMIPRNVKLAEAPANGLCIHQHAPTSPGAQAYAAFAKEVRG